MSRDGLLPKLFSAVHPKYKTPVLVHLDRLLCGGIPAGFVDIGTRADLANIGRCLPSCWFRWESFCCAAINPTASERFACRLCRGSRYSRCCSARTDVRADADYLAALVIWLALGLIITFFIVGIIASSGKSRSEVRS